MTVDTNNNLQHDLHHYICITEGEKIPLKSRNDMFIIILLILQYSVTVCIIHQLKLWPPLKS